jgi:hypothetical protein
MELSYAYSIILKYFIVPLLRIQHATQRVKPGQKFASDSKKDISDPHPAILELVSLLDIVGIDIAEIGDLNDKGASFRDIQRYIMASH